MKIVKSQLIIIYWYFTVDAGLLNFNAQTTAGLDKGETPLKILEKTDP